MCAKNYASWFMCFENVRIQTVTGFLAHPVVSLCTSNPSFLRLCDALVIFRKDYNT